MSEPKKEHRTLEAIHTEYSQLCLKAGHLQYQIAVMTKDLDILNENLKDLNLEAAAAQAAKASEPKKEEEKK